MKLKQVEPQYTNNLGKLKPDTQDEWYLAKILINNMRVTPGAYENHKFHYNQSTVPKPPGELQRLIFPFIKIFSN